LQTEARTRLNADTDLQDHIDDEETRAKAAEATLQTNIDAIGQSGSAAVAAERERAQAAESTLDGKIDAETDRAEDAEQTLTDAIAQEVTDRTAAVAAEATARTDADAALQTAINGKQATIADLAAIRSGAAAGATAYQKPATGIPATDMSAGVQTSLDKADSALQEHQSLADYYTKSEVDSLITTPDQEYVSVTATAQTTAVTDLLPATGAADTIYRVGNWDGTQYDPTMYALFAWNGTTYVCLAVRSFVGEVYDISVNHPDGQGNPTPYADLTAALGTDGANIPADFRRGGMSIKFIQGNAQSSDNKYVQYFLSKDEWSAIEVDWQKMNLEEEVNQLGLQVISDINAIDSFVGKSVVDLVDFSDLNSVTIPFTADTGDSIVVSMENIGSNNDTPLIHLINKDDTETNLGYLPVNVGETNSKTETLAKDIVAVRFDVGAHRSVYNVELINNNGLSSQIDDLDSEMSDFKSEANGRIRTLELTVGVPHENVVDFTNTNSVYTEILIKKNSTIYVTISNKGANTDSVGISFKFADNTESIVYNRTVNAGEKKSFEFEREEIEKDVVGITYGIGNYRNIYDVSVVIKGNILETVNDTSEYLEYLDSAKSENLCNLEEFILGSYINSSGAIAPLDEEHAVSGKIYFKGHSKITCNHSTNGEGYYCAIYGENDDDVKQVIPVNGRPVSPVTVQNVIGGKYVRFEINLKLNGEPVINYGEDVIPYTPFYKIGRIKKVNYLYAYADDGTDDSTHFYGNTAIRKAMESINDADAFNTYVIKAKGNFIATLPSDYKRYDSDYVMFRMKPFVTLDGGNKEFCVVRGELPDIVAECQVDTPSFQRSDYSIYCPSEMPAGGVMKNVTIIAKNNRYPIHIDGSNSEHCRNMEYIFEDCKLIHEGKFGDSIGTIGGVCCGLGLSEMTTTKFKNVMFSSDQGLYMHDNHFNTYPAYLEFDNCTVCSSSSDAVQFHFLKNKVGTVINVNNCKFMNQGSIATLSYLEHEGYDVYDIRKLMNGSVNFVGTTPMPVKINENNEFGLRVKSSNTDNSTVRFDKNSSAFDIIIGFSEEVDYIGFNKFARSQQYGYQWKDGGVGLNAEAIGFRRINDSSYKLGVLLGDCTTNNKTLTVVIDGATFNIVFNRNYSSDSNSTILSEINNVIDGYGIADLYPVNTDFYPEFDNMSISEVDDSSAILVGMGIAFTDNGVRKASELDDGIDGIAIDNGANGQKIRIIRKGGIVCDPAYNKTLRLKDGVTNLQFNEKLGISDINGVFSNITDKPSVIYKTNNTAYII